jgi:NhaA family Na+:H+ antiporter
MPIKKYLINPIAELAETGKLTGLLLIVATAFSLFLSNSDYGASFIQIWEHEIGFSFLHKSILHWINDGLMPLFFLLVGIEIKRELTKGELSDFKKAVLPVGAAVGGILIPAAIFILFNFRNAENMSGWAIPTATDIAFSLGVLSLLGKRVPFTLKVFLVALAIIDDLGAIVIIAAFYSHDMNVMMLILALATFVVLLIFSRFRVKSTLLYIAGGGFLWFFIMKSGIHPTIAGVLVALIVPRELAEEMEHTLTRPVSYFILPLFALANTAIPLSFQLGEGLFNAISIGIIAGLVLGKPIGIIGIPLILKKLNLGDLPEGVTWRHIVGVGFIAGIGFTMSIFIASLSFDEGNSASVAKLAIIIGSIVAAITGTIILRCCPKEGSGQ